MVNWQGRKVVITGGASFIGSHLVDTLIQKGAEVIVADDFSSGKLANLDYPLEQDGPGVFVAHGLTVLKGDLKEKGFVRQVLRDADVVFHLAASHGGRGYIASHPADCCGNMTLDQLVLEEACKAGVERFIYASSACVYPSYLQEEAGSRYLLREEDADPFTRDRALPDLEYGWAKLMGEMSLRAYHRQYGLKGASARIFTAYGPRENETHAVIALIAKAFIRMDPYEIWGTGKQERNFTYVQDIVDGLLLLAERVEDASALNIGREDRISLNKAAEIVFDILGWRPKEIYWDHGKPEGVASRAADLTTTRRILGWEPQVGYRERFERTIRWYVQNRKVDEVRRDLGRLLWERE